MKLRKIWEKIWKKEIIREEKTIDYQEMITLQKNDRSAILLDVRSPQEYKEGHLEGSINIALYDLEMQAKQRLSNKRNVIIVYCQSGNRSKKAIEILKKLGYENLYQLDGGLDKL